MTRRGLVLYIGLVAVYEALLAALYAWLPSGPPITFDPRLAINWIFVSTLDSVPQPLTVVLLVSFLWHTVSAVGILRSRKMILAFALGETVFSIPGALLYGFAIVGPPTNHGFSGGFVVVGMLVFVICSVIPTWGAYRLVFSG